MIKRISLIFLLLLIATRHTQAITVTATAGQLANVVTNHGITSLEINGSIDARDFKFIADELTELKTLVLTNVAIKSYQGKQSDNLLGSEQHFAENTIPYCALVGLVKLSKVRLPENLTAIGFGAFAGCSSLTSINLPASLQVIGDNAFNSCSALKYMTIAGNIKNLGAKAFAHCSELEYLIINPEVPIEIGDEAFADCGKLFSVKIGANVTSVGNGAFNGCTALKTISINPGSKIESIGDKAFYASALEKINLDAMPRLKHLGAWALARTKLSKFSLPTHVKSLDEGTLFYNKSLKTIEFPKTLTYLPDYMLAGCDNIVDAAFMTQHMGNIGDYALYNQSQHTSLKLPFQVYYIGTQAMAGMTGLNQITSEPLEVPELGEDVWAGINQSKVKLLVNKDVINDYKAADQWMNFLVNIAQLRGDINSDGFVNTIDATAERNYLIDGTTQGINTSLTDVNGDGIVNVADIVSIYNIINGNEPPSQPGLHHADDTMEGNGETVSSKNAILTITLENSRNYTASQFDITTPANITINNAKLTDRCFGHQLYLKQAGTNHYMLYCYSPAGDDIDQYDGAILTFEITSTANISTNDKISFNAITFVDYEENSYSLKPRDINLIGISAIDNITVDDSNRPVDVYNTQGQLLRTGADPATATQGLPPGIYIVGGKKVLVK